MRRHVRYRPWGRPDPSGNYSPKRPGGLPAFARGLTGERFCFLMEGVICRAEKTRPGLFSAQGKIFRLKERP